MKHGFCAAVAMLVIATTSAAFAQGALSGSSCDRACLLGIADAYFAALAAHDPAKAPMAPNAKFTEQAQVLTVGDGLWKTTTEGPTTFKIPVPDPVTGQIGVIAMIKANVPAPPARAGGPPTPPGPYAVQLALRLKVENRRITEAEHIYATIVAPSQIAAVQTPRAPLLADVPAAVRSPRDLMLLIGNSYSSGQIHEIEAMGFTLPLYSKNGWSPFLR